jgi:hypothetical protein
VPQALPVAPLGIRLIVAEGQSAKIAAPLDVSLVELADELSEREGPLRGIGITNTASYSSTTRYAMPPGTREARRLMMSLVVDCSAMRAISTSPGKKPGRYTPPMNDG